MKITTYLSVNNGNLGAIARKFALFTKGSKLLLNKGFKNMFELLQSCAKPSIYTHCHYLAPAHAKAFLSLQLSIRGPRLVGLELNGLVNTYKVMLSWSV